MPTVARLNHSQAVPKRIALFTGNYNVVADGVSLTLNRLVAHLEANGATVLVFGPTARTPGLDHAGTLVSVPSVVLPMQSSYRFSVGFPRAARRQLVAFAPTLVHIATPDPLGLFALHTARRHGIPVVASYHTDFCSYLHYYRMGTLEAVLWQYLRWFYRRCRHVYVGSTSVMCTLQRHGITTGLRLWQRGVDPELFDPQRRSASWRREMSLSEGQPLITFVGRVAKEKGLDVFAQVIQQLEAIGVPHRSMIVGDGPMLGELRARLRNTIFTGVLRGLPLARAYASSDIFLFPSETETFGNVTLEAMASGVPPVCADAAGSNSIVVADVSGFLAAPGVVESFVQHIVRLAEDSVLRTRIGRAARERAMEYDWDATLARLLEYYDEILNPAAVPRPPRSAPTSKIAQPRG